MKKRVIIVHGWEGNPDIHWFPWIKKELEQKGFEVHIPQMPNTMNPTFQTWIPYLQNFIKNVDENTIFVGHSLGCIAILRFIETLKEKVGGAVLVAGFGKDLKYEGYKDELSSFFETPINWEKIKQNCDKFIAIHSMDDKWVNIKNNELFKENLKAESVVVDGMGHFNVKELPLVLEQVLSISR